MKLSAMEIWEKLDRLRQQVDIPNYSSIIENLLFIADTMLDVNYDTRKNMDFWYEKIVDLKTYIDLFNERVA